MKKTKVIIPALGILLLSTAASVTGTVAWFSANSTVNANGMKVQATTSESLVINTECPVGTKTKISFTDDDDDPIVLSPATHDLSYETGLKYVKNNEDVDAATGVASNPTYLDATNGELNTYYVDYDCYIAAAGAEMSGKTVKFAFDKATKDAVTTWTDTAAVSYDTLKAFSVDIYMETVTTQNAKASISADSFIGTIALKSNAADFVQDDVDGDGWTIPQNGIQASYLAIKFRVYLDGELEKDTNQKYVYTNKVNVSDVSIGIDINVK